jgi:hypothetical protein
MDVPHLFSIDTEDQRKPFCAFALPDTASSSICSLSAGYRV